MGCWKKLIVTFDLDIDIDSAVKQSYEKRENISYWM